MSRTKDGNGSSAVTFDINGDSTGNGGAAGKPASGIVNGAPIVDPAGIAGTGATVADTGGSGGDSASSVGSDGKRKRGRPPGSRNNGTAAPKAAKVDISGIEKLLFSTHMMFAGFAKTPELAIDPAEAKTLAEATANVARHYNVAISEKTQDWANFLMALGAIYGTRFVAIARRKGDEKKAAKSNNVVDMAGKPVNPGVVNLQDLPLNPGIPPQTFN